MHKCDEAMQLASLVGARKKRKKIGESLATLEAASQSIDTRIPCNSRI